MTVVLVVVEVDVLVDEEVLLDVEVELVDVEVDVLLVVGMLVDVLVVVVVVEVDVEVLLVDGRLVDVLVDVELVDEDVVVGSSEVLVLVEDDVDDVVGCSEVEVEVLVEDDVVVGSSDVLVLVDVEVDDVVGCKDVLVEVDVEELVLDEVVSGARCVVVVVDVELLVEVVDDDVLEDVEVDELVLVELLVLVDEEVDVVEVEVLLLVDVDDEVEVEVVEVVAHGHCVGVRAHAGAASNHHTRSSPVPRRWPRPRLTHSQVRAVRHVQCPRAVGLDVRPIAPDGWIVDRPRHGRRVRRERHRIHGGEADGRHGGPRHGVLGVLQDDRHGGRAGPDQVDDERLGPFADADDAGPLAGGGLRRREDACRRVQLEGGRSTRGGRRRGENRRRHREPEEGGKEVDRPHRQIARNLNGVMGADVKLASASGEVFAAVVATEQTYLNVEKLKPQTALGAFVLVGAGVVTRLTRTDVPSPQRARAVADMVAAEPSASPPPFVYAPVPTQAPLVS
jgi:hypothetical protein